jgi:PelA/Pel-15E family pectate lyase
VDAVRDGVAFLKSSAIHGQEWSGGRGTEGGRHLAPKAGAGPIWPRTLSLTTEKPIFGDRDKTIHDDVNEISLERRNGYSWYSAGPQRAIDAYAGWVPR